MPIPASIWGIHDDIGNGRPSGAGYQRIVLPFEELRKHGWVADYETAGSPDVSGYSLIAGQRLAEHRSLTPWRHLHTRHRLIYEIDDNVFAQRHDFYGRPDVQDTIKRAAGVADLVTVSTNALAEVMRQINPNVAVLPNCIPGYLLGLRRPVRQQLTVGWTCSFSHDQDTSVIADPCHKLLAGIDAQFHLIGADFRRELGLPGMRYTPGWWDASRHDRYYKLIDFDVGLAPLTGTKFDMAKSCLKALEYAALGIPVIASDCEPYRDFVRDGVTGFLVRTAEEWLDRMYLLVSDPDLRNTMGTKARIAAADWAIEGNWQRWDEAYRSLL
jgi:glycosyltransferase involved in cell wall biosynthesis